MDSGMALKITGDVSHVIQGYVSRSSCALTKIYGVTFTLWSLTLTYELQNVTHATRAR